MTEQSNRDESTITTRGGPDRPVKLIVGGFGPRHVLVWIDGPDGELIANVRLTRDDTKRLIARLAQALNPQVYGEHEEEVSR